MGASGGPDLVQDKLVLSLDSVDKNSYPGSGTTWSDLSVKGNDGTLTNGPALSDGHMNFDGSNDYVNCGTDSSLNVGTGDFTFEAWARCDDNEGGSYPGIIGRHTNNSNYMHLHYNTANNFDGGFFVRETGETDAESLSTNNLNDGEWHHLVGVKSASTCRIYVDGSKEGEDTNGSASPSFTTETFRLSSFYASMSGSIDIARVYNKALSDEEVSQNFNAQRTRFGV
jgi:hypothetical protein